MTATSFLSVGVGEELVLRLILPAAAQWTLKRKWGPRKTAQLEALRTYPILPYDRNMAWSWARVEERKEERKGDCAKKLGKGG